MKHYLIKTLDELENVAVVRLLDGKLEMLAGVRTLKDLGCSTKDDKINYSRKELVGFEINQVYANDLKKAFKDYEFGTNFSELKWREEKITAVL